MRQLVPGVSVARSTVLGAGRILLLRARFPAPLERHPDASPSCVVEAASVLACSSHDLPVRRRNLGANIGCHLRDDTIIRASRGSTSSLSPVNANTLSSSSRCSGGKARSTTSVPMKTGTLTASGQSQSSRKRGSGTAGSRDLAAAGVAFENRRFRVPRGQLGRKRRTQGRTPPQREPYGVGEAASEPGYYACGNESSQRFSFSGERRLRSCRCKCRRS